MASPKSKKKRTKADDLPAYEVALYEDYKLSPKQEQVIAYLAMNTYRPGENTKDGTVKRCCELFNLGKTTLYEWLDIGAFKSALIEASTACHAKILTAAYKKIERGDTQIIDKLLDAINPERFSQRLQMAELRYQFELKLAALKHEQQKEVIKLQAELKTVDNTRDDIAISFEETAQGEIIDQSGANDSDD